METNSGSRLRTLVVYALMIGAGVAIFQGVCAVGSSLAPAAGPQTASVASGTGKVEVLGHVLAALLVILVASRLLGGLFARLKQPPVIGEVVAGIALGPSLLGRFAPELSTAILPAPVAPYLAVLAQIGVILYMFTVGLELDTSLLRRRAHATVAVSHASILVPFLLGAGLSLVLYPRLATGDVPFAPFALFLGISMSVTAFPVLARILTDRNLSRSRLGVVAMSCAAVDDITAWCLLAFVVAVVKSQAGGGLLTTALALGYLALMLVVVRPLLLGLVAWLERRPDVGGDGMAAVLALMLGSALATEAIGIHALFGAFLVGAIVPHDSRVARELGGRLRDMVVVFLLPAFFAFTGMRTRIGLVDGAEQWLLCGAIIVVASLGKFGGSVVAARLTGTPWRDAAALGILMNTRGLVELIVLNIGYDLGVISPRLFAMLVVMALVTTAATTPILDRLTRADEEPVVRHLEADTAF